MHACFRLSWNCLTVSSCYGYAVFAFICIVIPKCHFDYYNENEKIWQKV